MLLEEHLRAKCTLLQGKDKGDSLPGLEALADADVMIVFTRRVQLSDEQLAAVQLNGLAAPDHTMKMTFLPGLSLSASKMRCAPAVKSMVFCGRPSSCVATILRATAWK